MNYRPSPSPVAFEAFPYVMILVVVSYSANLIGYQSTSVFAMFLLFYVLVFFRNPERYGPRKEDAVYSGADGKIVAAGIIPHPDFPDGQCLRIGIFMSLFDVHMNWAPFAGEVTRTEYYPGQFLNAMDDKAAEQNERKVVWLKTQDGETMVVKLVAGLVARRIVCPLEAGDVLQRGEKIGLIRFGSRVEILLPARARLCVAPGMMVRGGETVVACLPPVPAESQA